MLDRGVYTSIVTPFKGFEGEKIDWEGIERNVEFQVQEGVAGILFVETIVGESATLSPEEHWLFLEMGIQCVEKRIFALAGTGSNSLKEALEYTDKAQCFGYKAVVLVAPYCNPVSSFDVRENYYRPVAEKFPKMIIIPYIVPKRTSSLIEPEDLAFLDRKTPNIYGIIEVSEDYERMKKIRNLTRSDFGIFSGDDTKTWEMITNKSISSHGVFSVISNIAPAAVCSMVEAIFKGEIKEAERINYALSPLLISTVRQEREVAIGNGNKTVTVWDEIYNPVIIKTMMNGLGVSVGPCRYPLGKMNQGSVAKVRNALKTVWINNPWVLKPLETFYGLNISNRLSDDKIWAELQIDENQ